MNIEQIKERVKQAYTDVDSIDFLETQITKGIERHRRNYREFIALNPDKDFAHWKKRISEEININTTNNNEVIAMGIFLLALDKFQPDE